MLAGVDPKGYIKARVKVSDGCWLWENHVAATGYGQAWLNGSPIGAHVLSFKTYHGSIPEGHVVRHKCDVRSCCNPEHLEVGTYADNMADCVDRGRIAAGERQGLSKLTWEAVDRIRNDGEPSKFLADLYGVSRVNINRVRRHVIWREDMRDRETQG